MDALTFSLSTNSERSIKNAMNNLSQAELKAARIKQEELQRKLFAKGTPYVSDYVKALNKAGK